MYVAKFIPIKDGTAIELGNTGIPGVSGIHKILGFKPGPGPQARGWLVVLVQTNEAGRTNPSGGVPKLRKLKAS